MLSKVIILDLDGTLLRKDKTVSQKTIDILKKCKNRGNIILFATARPPRDAYKYVPENLRDNPIICYNGACIINGKDILYKKEIKKDDVFETLKNIKKLNYEKICLEINDKLYSNFNVEKFFGKVPCEEVDLFKLDFEGAFKIIVCNEKIDEDILKNIPKTCKGIITDNNSLCQIMNCESSKWNSINYLLQKLNHSSDDVIAFGDDYNDMDMIKNACIGVAMENAEEDLKTIAKYVTVTNEEDGVAKFLEKNIL